MAQRDKYSGYSLKFLTAAGTGYNTMEINEYPLSRERISQIAHETLARNMFHGKTWTIDIRSVQVTPIARMWDAYRRGGAGWVNQHRPKEAFYIPIEEYDKF
jgi:hypothetical protein